MGRGGARSLLVSELSEFGTVQQLHAAIFDQELSSAAIDLHFFTDGLTTPFHQWPTMHISEVHPRVQTPTMTMLFFDSP